jgi:hypothetical protein
MTYFVSAFWHGLYPGFFFFFMSVPLLTNIERLARAKINPLIVPQFDGRNMDTYPRSVVGYVYWFTCWFLTTTTVNYMVQVRLLAVRLHIPPVLLFQLVQALL